MFAPLASRLNAAQHTRNVVASTRFHSLARCAVLRCGVRPPCTPVDCSRLKTTAANRGPEKRFKYPEYLNVYRAGSNKTLFLGFSRIAAVVLFPVGCFFGLGFYFSPDHSSWLFFPFAIASAVPLTVMMLATGPYVHAISVRLPPSVRTSRDELARFADNMPGNAELRISCMRALPWPTKRDVKFGLLRKYRPSLRRGLSNLEYVPDTAKEAEGYEGTWWHNLIKNFLGRFMVDNIVQDRSSSPGLWVKMWKQIPELGSEHDPAKRIGIVGKEKKPVALANRPQRATDAPIRPTVRPGSGKR